MPLRASAARRLLRAAAAIVLVVLAAALAVHRLAPGAAPAYGPVAVAVRPVAFDRIAPERQRFGALEWRGGLVLSAPAPFGGFSALALSDDGTRMVAVSDEGVWLTARLRYAGGRLAGLDEAVLAPMRGEDGAILTDKWDRDAEGLARIDGADGRPDYLVAFERRHRIVRYRGPEAGFAPLGEVPLGDIVAELPENRGIEALGVLPGAAGAPATIVAVAERALDGRGDHRGWLIGPDGAAAAFSVVRRGRFDVTGLAFLPGGDMVLLERRYIPLVGAAFRLRRIAGEDIRPGARLDGPVLIEADRGYEIDNMEGLAVHRGADGETVLTLISDDNFWPLQRTLLLQFALAD